MAERRNLGRGTCRVCGDEYNLTSNGRIRSHGPRDFRCQGGSDLPAEEVDVRTAEGGPTNADAARNATVNADREAQAAEEADVRTAENGTVMTVHGGPNPHRAPLDPNDRGTVQPSEAPVPAPFAAAVPVSQTPTVRGGESGLRPGPEQTDFDQWGRYKIPDPATGAVAGRQRVTTFVKMLSDQWGLSQWQQRVLLVGAGNNPQMSALAAGKDAKRDKAFLDGLATSIKDAAGSKDAAAHGTMMHTHTERADMGLMDEAEWAGLPDAIRRDLNAYLEAIEGAGLVPLPEMVERTTMVRSLDVTGTLDRVFRLPNGDHVIGDVKTGQDLSYGWLDIGMQLACYAHGVNENGVFDWGSRQWIPAPEVRTNCALARSVRDARKVRNHAEVLDLDSLRVVAVEPQAIEAAEPAPLAVQPHSEAFTAPVADPRRDKARSLMGAVAAPQAAAELYAFALEVWPEDEDFLLGLAGIGRSALRNV